MLLSSVLVLLSAVPAVGAAGLEATLELPKTEFVVAEPIHVTGSVVNVSGQSLVVPRGFRVSFLVDRVDGLPRRACEPRRGTRGSGRETEEVAAAWSRTYIETLDCHDEPGEYVLRFSVESPATGPDDGSGSALQKPRSWSGRIESTGVRIRITEAHGVDREALQAYGGRPLWFPDDLLRTHPASTYAGYALLGGRPWDLDPVAELGLKGSFLELAAEDPTLRPQMERLEREQQELSEDRARRLERYLSERPDFVYASSMRLELATRLAYLGRRAESRTLCEQLLRDASASPAEVAKAKRLLGSGLTF